jgi:fucose 4-O-acetylase-like acetyltransferase
VISRITGDRPPPRGDRLEASDGRREPGPASASSPDAPGPIDKPPLPVRQPRRRGAVAAAGQADQETPAQGFDYFAASTSPKNDGPDTRSPETSGPWAFQGTGPHAFPAPARPPARDPRGPQWPETTEEGAPAGQWDPWRRTAQDGDGGAWQAFDGTGTGTTDRPMRDRPMRDLPAEELSMPAWASAPAQTATGTGPLPQQFAQRTRQAAPAGWDGQETEQEPEPAPQGKRPREPFLDNVKFILIALVATGHSLVPTLAADSSRAAYLFIYVFHMPLFVTISGYLSRNFWNSSTKTTKLVDNFLIPYVVVEIGYAGLRTAFGHEFSISITDPAWLNWYLLALLLWRLSTPVWQRVRFPLVIAVIIYVVAGLTDLSGDFSIDRFFGLLPFFVLGLVIKPGLFEFLARAWVRVLSVLVIAGAAAVAIYLVKNYSVKLGPIYYSQSYQDLHLIWWKGMALRMALLGAALTMSAAVLSLIPRSETWFSDLGTRTLYCYLLHGVPVMIAKEMGWLSAPWLFGPLGVAAIASACFALAIVLCMPITRTLFKWLLEPRLSWLYRKSEQPA